ncbi:MAG: helix-hairpin-helix domain-containing protein [Firmicutes bacterium]|nr:helix-hairpin-helix domain-containing protein [Bacillota bacterium]
MSWRATLALFILALTFSFLRGYLALGQAGVVWYYTDLGPLPAPEEGERAESEDSGAVGKVDLNTASGEQLEELPGIGPVLAGRIVEYRKEAGGFKTLAELQRVKGIGEAKYAELLPFITLTSSDAE